MLNNRREWLWLLALLLIAFALRLVGLHGQSLSMDECVERGIALLPISNIIHEPNSFPPLYHLLLKIWLWLSDTEISTRWFSLVLAMVSIAVTWFAASDLLDRKTAIWTTSLAATSPFHIFYSQDGRAYMLYLLLAITSIWLGLRLAREASRRNQILFVLVGVVGGYTHYYFAIVLVTVTVCGVICYGKTAIPSFFKAAIAIGICCVPLVFLLKGDLTFQQELRAARPMNAVSVGYTFFSFASGYTLGPSRSELHSISGKEAVMQTLPWLVLAALCYGTPFIVGCRRLQQDRKLVTWLALLLLPLLIVGVCCLALGLTYNPRFLVWLWLPFAVICATGFAALSNKPRLVLFGLVLIMSAAAIGNRQWSMSHRNEDLRSAARFVQQQSRPVAVCSAYMIGPLITYLDDSVSDNTNVNAGLFDGVVALDDASSADGNVEKAISQLRRFEGPYWLVYSREFHGDPDGEILRAATGQADPTPAFTTAGVQVFEGNPTP